MCNRRNRQVKMHRLFLNSSLYKQLEKLHKSPDSKVIIRTVSCLLKRESAFAAFKRCYVREHADKYPQLQKYVLLD